MFFYIYDEHALAPTQADALAKVEGRIIELGINGRVEKLAPLRNIKSLIEIALKQKMHTVVVVGGDETLLRVLNLIAASSLVLGFIPFQKNSQLANLFGITDTFEACNILSRRIVRSLDLGKVNQNFFLRELSCTSLADVRIECDGKYTVSSNERFGSATISVLGERLQLAITTQAKPTGWLKKRSALPDRTTLFAEHITIQHQTEPVAMLLDQLTTLKTPLTIIAKPHQVKMVVGKSHQLR